MTAEEDTTTVAMTTKASESFGSVIPSCNGMCQNGTSCEMTARWMLCCMYLFCITFQNKIPRPSIVKYRRIQIEALVSRGGERLNKRGWRRLKAEMLQHSNDAGLRS